MRQPGELARRRGVALVSVALAIVGVAVGLVSAEQLANASGSTLRELSAVAARPSLAKQSGEVSATGMRNAARALMGALDVTRRDWMHTGFDDAERFDWNYTPTDRSGLPLRQLDDSKRELAWDLVATGVGARGLAQARQIVTLEEILQQRTRSGAIDPGMYLTAIFGSPGSLGTWGWRFEGHHLSLNFTILDNDVVGATPMFFGAQPAHVTEEGEHLGLRPFAEEQDQARALLLSFDEETRRRAYFTDNTPVDILTGNDARVARQSPMGIAYAEMNADQQRALRELLGLYAARFTEAYAALELDEIEAEGIENVRFAWAGGTELDETHYYQISGPTFIVEFDSTQNDPNHIHTVWRNYARDFGRDPLRVHLMEGHGMAAESGSHADGAIAPSHGHDHSPE